MQTITQKIRLVEELEQAQLDELKEGVFWGDSSVADFSNLNEQEREQVDEALFESDISNTIIYKLFRDIYFTTSARG